jgi:hypothetical protein
MASDGEAANHAGDMNIPGQPAEAHTASSNNGLHRRSPPSKDSDVEAQAVVDVPKAVEEKQAEPEFADVSWLDIVKQFSILGWTAFGGPAAHIGLFQRVRCQQQRGGR